MANKIAIVVSEFNESITQSMQKRAETEIQNNGAEISETINVPGAMEIPFATKKALKNADAAVVLGAVIQGDTDHDVIIVNAIAPKLIDLSMQENKPVGFGVIGPRVSKSQAEARAEEYATRAVHTVVELLKLS